jgi:hypothetical protein
MDNGRNTGRKKAVLGAPKALNTHAFAFFRLQEFISYVTTYEVVLPLCLLVIRVMLVTGGFLHF